MSDPTNGRSSNSGELGRPSTGRRRPTSGETARELDPARRASDRRGVPRPAPRAPEPAPFIVRRAREIRWATWIGVLALAARLILPRPDGWQRWNDAGQALLDVDAARTAALVAYQQGGRVWPAPGRLGVAPHAFLPNLAGTASFGRPRYHLAWEFAADTTAGMQVVGVSVIGEDPLLAMAMAKRAQPGMSFVIAGPRFIALLASSTGR